MAFIGDLWGYQRVVLFKLSEAFPEEFKKHADKPSKYWVEQLEPYFLKDTHKFSFDEVNTIVTLTRTDIPDLAATIHQHFILLSAAFPALVRHFGEEDLKTRFMTQTVLRDQGWQEHELEENKGHLGVTRLKQELARLDIDPPIAKTSAAPVPSHTFKPSSQ